MIVPDTGSGYGGKHTGEAAVEAARLAKAAGRPVKLVWTREEEFTWAYFRPAGVIDIKAGARKDGTLTAWEFHNYNSGTSGIQNPYRTPNQVVAVPPGAIAAAPGLLPGPGGHGEPLRPRVAHGRAGPRRRDRPARVPAQEPQGGAACAPCSRPRRNRSAGAASRAPIAASASRCGTEKGGYVATCAEVAVDRSSGRVQVVRAVTAFECGAVVNPDHLKNQVEGAVIMGLGGALFEAIAFDDGKIQNPNSRKYRVPRFRDVPEIEVVLIDRKDVPSAGAGETPIVAIAPAVGNAIFDADRRAAAIDAHGAPRAEGLKAAEGSIRGKH